MMFSQKGGKAAPSLAGDLASSPPAAHHTGPFRAAFSLRSPGSPTRSRRSFAHCHLPALRAPGPLLSTPLRKSGRNPAQSSPEGTRIRPGHRNWWQSTLRRVPGSPRAAARLQEPESHRPNWSKPASPSSRRPALPAPQMAAVSAPRTRASAVPAARPGRGARGAAARRGAERGWVRGGGAGRARRRRLPPSHRPYLPRRPRSRPRGVCPPGRAGCRRGQRAAGGAARQGSLITLGGCGTARLRRPPPSPPPCTGGPRQPAARARCPPPRRLAGQLPPPPLLPGTGTRRARAGAEAPARARDWEAGGGRSRGPGGRRCGLLGAGLCAAAPPAALAPRPRGRPPRAAAGVRAAGGLGTRAGRRAPAGRAGRAGGWRDAGMQGCRDAGMEGAPSSRRV